jgi:hypothetical protein
MKRLAVAMLGMLVGGAIGWLVCWALFPSGHMAFSTAGTRDLDYAFQFLGLLIGCGLGFIGCFLAALMWIHEPERARPDLKMPVDPREVHDNLG